MIAPTVRALSPDDPEVEALLGQVAREPAESVFLSAWWLRACLETWPVGAGHRVLAIGRDPAGPAGAGDALALLGSRALRRHGWLRCRALGLNEALDDDLDEPTVELNGLHGALDAEFEPLFDRLLGWLDGRGDWDELRVPGVLAARGDLLRTLAARHGLRTRVAKRAQTWWVDLAAVRARHGGDYLAALSSNTRQQLRRSRRAIESALGPLAIEQAADVECALRWLDELAQLHRTRWAVPGSRSGFDIPSFRDFHRRLIGRAFAEGGVQLLRISAGDEAIAYLYNLVLDGHVYFLMSGIDLARFERFKPGMLAHQLAIERNLAEGARIYDFLGGSQRYKASLGTHSDEQVWLVLWRPRLGLLLEDALRRLKQRVDGRNARRNSPGPVSPDA